MNWQRSEVKALWLLILQCLIWQSIAQHIHEYATKLLNEQMKEFSCGTLYYRTFFMDLDTDTLYVGAMNRIFRLDLKNINSSDCNTPNYKPTLIHSEQCQIKLKTAYECQNHIRVIQKMKDDKIYVCGTNAFNPRDFIVDAKNLVPLNIFNPMLGQGAAKCPYDPADNSTALWVENGNPLNLSALYSGTVADGNRGFAVVFRDTVYFPNNTKAYGYKSLPSYVQYLLLEPNFVGSYDIGEHVYFFFRETSVEYLSYGKMIYSRVARVCKKDTGSHLSTTSWVTYFKARLNCSIPGKFPFAFNEIQSVFRVPNETRFYAVFISSQNGLIGSAICSFNMTEIDNAFNGRFMTRVGGTKFWTPYPKTDEPEPRPGKCVPATSTLTDDVINFVREHPIMESSINSDFEKPIFFKSEVVLLHLVVTRLGEYTIYYAGSDKGMIYKVVQWEEYLKVYSNLVSIYEATTPEPIRNMEISYKQKYIYVASDSMVRQINLALCKGQYDSCAGCVRDPYCGWSKANQLCEIFTVDSKLLQDVKNEQVKICEEIVNWTTMDVYLGQSAHLKCQVNVPRFKSAVIWLKNNIPIKNSAKFVYTQDNGLVVMDIDQQSAGRYECRAGMDVLCRHTVNIDAETCRTPKDENDYRQVYKDWCNEFQKYKKEMKKWESNKKSCYKHPNET